MASTDATSTAAAGAGAGAGAGGDAGASTKLRFAIVSTARIGLKVCPAIQSAPNAEVTVVASRSVERAEAWAKEQGVGSWCTYDELLTRDDVDAVYVPLPTGLRNDYLIKAAKAGKHVYSEKPLSGTYEQFKEVIDACAAAGVQFMDGTMWVHSTRTREIESRVAAGAIGRVMRVNAAFTFRYPSEEWLNGGDGRTDKTREPMGCFGDQGWYPISAIMWAFNYELPTRVLMTHTRTNTVDTVVTAGGTLWFADGRMAHFDAGCEMAHRSYFELVGETGVIRVDDLVGGQGRSGNFAAYEKPFTGSDSFTQGDATGKDEVVKVEPCDHAERLAFDFAAAALSGTPDPQWPRRSLAMHRVMTALFASYEAGHTVITLADLSS